jgi:hypothetical protein
MDVEVVERPALHLASSGRAMSYEVYRNTPMNAKPEDLVTDLYLSIE